MNIAYDDCSTYLRFYLIYFFFEGAGYFFMLYKVLISFYFLASAGNVYFNLLLFHTLYQPIRGRSSGTEKQNTRSSVTL